MKIKSLSRAGQAIAQAVFILAVAQAACSSSSSPSEGAGGSSGNGGTAGSGGGGSGGMGGGGASSGTLAKSAIDGCVYAYTPVPNCDGTGKPYYWECPGDPTVSPAAGCELPPNGNPGSWCCPSMFCSRYASGDSFCALLYAAAPNGQICVPGTPGLASCSGPPSPSTPSVFCCP